MSDDAPTIETAPAKPPVRFRRLRITVSVFFGLLTVALVVLWVRSYWSLDLLSRREIVPSQFGFKGSSVVTFGSNHGYVYFIRMFTPTFAMHQVKEHGWRVSSVASEDTLPRFEWTKTLQKTKVVAPYWFLFTICATCTCLPWLSCRFSLRTMLITMTLVAVALGLVVWVVR